jgi:uncharacterized membrane protein (DUF485 family)
MTLETDEIVERVKNDPQFHELVRRRSTLAWSLTALMITIYFGFVLTVAFHKELLGQSLFGGVTTVGIPVGISVILAAFILTAIYVSRANTTFDDMTKRIIARVTS